VTFYDTLNLARDHRAAVREAVVSLGDLVKQYGNEVQQISDTVKDAQK
jgi:hypothetical protein